MTRVLNPSSILKISVRTLSLDLVPFSSTLTPVFLSTLYLNSLAILHYTIFMLFLLYNTWNIWNKMVFSGQSAFTCHFSPWNIVLPTRHGSATILIYQLNPIYTYHCTFLYYLNLLLLLCRLGLQPVCYILFSVFHNKYALCNWRYKSDASIIVIRNNPFFCSEIFTRFPNLQFNKILSMHPFQNTLPIYFSKTLWNPYKINSF